MPVYIYVTLVQTSCGILVIGGTHIDVGLEVYNPAFEVETSSDGTPFPPLYIKLV